MSFAPKITPDDARVDWKLPAHVVDRQVRACTPAPGRLDELGGERLKLGPVRRSADAARATRRPRRTSGPASCRPAATRVLVGTGRRPVRLGDVQAAGQAPHDRPPTGPAALRSGGPVRFG